MVPDAETLDRTLYEVMDAIQHDWTRGPINLDPAVKLLLVIQLRATRNEINWLLSQLEPSKA
jgi:hypothetical protein